MGRYGYRAEGSSFRSTWSRLVRRVHYQLAILLAVVAGPWSAASHAQNRASEAPWQQAENHPGSKSRPSVGMRSLKKWTARKSKSSASEDAADIATPVDAGSTVLSARANGGASGGWPNDGSKYAQSVSPSAKPATKPTANAPSAGDVDLASADVSVEPDGVESVPAPEPETIAPGDVSEVETGEIGEFADEDFSLFNPTPDDPVFHEGRDALIYEGKWNNCLNNWYAVTQVTLLHRQSPAKTPISFQRVLALTTSGQVVQQFNKMQEARVLHFGVEPGMRVTLGRNLFTDIVNRQHSIEFTFLGLNHWRDNNFFEGGPGSSSSTRFVFPGLYSGFPLTQGGFNAASNHNLFDSSNMNNYEINYRVGKLPRPDRIVQLPNGRWARCGTPCIVVSGLAGFRAVTIDEHFLFLSNGTYTGNVPFSGSYKMDTSNNLFGAQIGGDATAQYNLFSLGIRGKVGVYGDAARRSANIVITDPQFGNQAASFRNFTDRTSCIADLGFVGTVRLKPGLNFRASYDFMWCGGLINAPEQQQYNLVKAYPIVNTGRMLFQGISLGFDATW